MRLKIDNLTVKYDETVIENLNLIVEDGEFCTLVGHSGTGKSTILKSIAGLIDIEVDDICLNDESVKLLSADQRQIGFVFQKPLLFPHLTVEENICFSLDIRKWSKKDKSKRVSDLLLLLELVGLEKRYPDELSGGQQQRVAIGRAMAFNPKIILMDEPFSSLDPRLRTSMGEFLKALQIQLKLTIVFVTHDPIEALRLSDRIAFIHDKRVVQFDIPSNVFNYPMMKVIGEFFGKANWIEGHVKDGFFESEYFRKKTTINSGLYHMFLRPHQIHLSDGLGWVVQKVHLIGKETLYQIKCEDQFLWVEIKGDPEFKLGESVSININENLHYLDR